MPSSSPPEQPPIRRAGTVALVGRSNVGKSTLMNALLGEALAIVSPIPQTTRNRVLGVVRHGEAQVGLLDTPGLHKPRSRLGKLMNAAARSAVDDADVVLFVTSSGARPGEPLFVMPGDRALLADIGKGKPTILVLNKIDLVRPRSLMLPLLDEIAKLRDFAAVVPISARREDGLDLLLDEVVKLLPEGGALWDEDELTDRPVRFFIAEFVREEILRIARQELPYVVAVTVDSYDESGKMPRIFATIHVEREGQKPIILGPGGTRLRDIGIAARERAETLLGHRIHLELFVRVTPGWTDNNRLLDEMGYGEDQHDTASPLADNRVEIDLSDAIADEPPPEGDEGEEDEDEGEEDEGEEAEGEEAEGEEDQAAEAPEQGGGEPPAKKLVRGPRPTAKVNHQGGERGRGKGERGAPKGKRPGKPGRPGQRDEARGAGRGEAGERRGGPRGEAGERRGAGRRDERPGDRRGARGAAGAEGASDTGKAGKPASRPGRQVSAASDRVSQAGDRVSHKGKGVSRGGDDVSRGGKGVSRGGGEGSRGERGGTRGERDAARGEKRGPRDDRRSPRGEAPAGREGKRGGPRREGDGAAAPGRAAGGEGREARREGPRRGDDRRRDQARPAAGARAGRAGEKSDRAGRGQRNSKAKS